MNTQMKPCCECKDTFEDDDLKKCESCEFFVCFDCIQSCGLVIDNGLEGFGDCGGEASIEEFCRDGSLLHEGCDIAKLDVCECDKGIWGGKRCEVTFCALHSVEFGLNDCMDCDSSRCSECSFSCEVCWWPSCISSECGGQCSGCKLKLCEDHLVEHECAVRIDAT